MLSMYSILDSNWTKQDRGANEAGIFYSICETCDHGLFSHYENKSNYKDSLPTKEMLQEIILKICVKEIYEHRIAAKLMLGIQESNYELSRIDAHIKITIETMKSFSLEKAFHLNNYLSETYSLK